MKDSFPLNPPAWFCQDHILHWQCQRFIELVVLIKYHFFKYLKTIVAILDQYFVKYRYIAQPFHSIILLPLTCIDLHLHKCSGPSFILAYLPMIDVIYQKMSLISPDTFFCYIIIQIRWSLKSESVKIWLGQLLHTCRKKLQKALLQTMTVNKHSRKHAVSENSSFNIIEMSQFVVYRSLLHRRLFPWWNYKFSKTCSQATML